MPRFLAIALDSRYSVRQPTTMLITKSDSNAVYSVFFLETLSTILAMHSGYYVRLNMMSSKESLIRRLIIAVDLELGRNRCALTHRLVMGERAGYSRSDGVIGPELSRIQSVGDIQQPFTRVCHHWRKLMKLNHPIADAYMAVISNRLRICTRRRCRNRKSSSIRLRSVPSTNCKLVVPVIKNVVSLTLQLWLGFGIAADLLTCSSLAYYLFKTTKLFRSVLRKLLHIGSILTRESDQ
jgi:hypothetical protein